MSEKKGASFVKGTLILAAASIIVKVIGAVFRIPLTNLVGSYAMGLYSTAYRYYTILLTIATAGLPIAISKMISESRALGRYSESKKIFKTALLTCIAIGLIGTLALLFGANGLANATKDINAAISIKALAPAVLFMAVTAAFRGFFQGHENMLPTALSQILEALSRLFIGFFLAWILLRSGMAEKYIAAGTISGVTAGTVLTVLLMVIFALALRPSRKTGTAIADASYKNRGYGKIFGALMMIAVPVTLGSLVINLTSAIDMFLITNRLAALGYASKRTTELFGIYDNYALPIFNLVPSIIISLNVSVTPTISAAYARKDTAGLHRTLLAALRIVIIFTLPAAVGISILAKPVLSLLYTSAADVAVAAPVLSILGIASFFLCASSLTSTAMQALGRAHIPLITMLAGAIVKIAANYFLIAIPGIELCGAAIGTILCYIVITVLNMIYLARFISFKPPFVATYLKPIFASVLMGAAVLLSYRVGAALAGGKLAVAIAILCGAAVYFVALLVLGGITRDDVRALPKGEKLERLIFRNR